MPAAVMCVSGLSGWAHLDTGNVFGKLKKNVYGFGIRFLLVISGQTEPVPPKRTTFWWWLFPARLRLPLGDLTLHTPPAPTCKPGPWPAGQAWGVGVGASCSQSQLSELLVSEAAGPGRGKERPRKGVLLRDPSTCG